MHARLSTYAGQGDELTKGFQAQVEPLEQLDGFKGAYFGVSDSGKSFSLTLWESQEALEVSAERAKQMRRTRRSHRAPRSSRSSTSRSRRPRAASSSSRPTGRSGC